jgi:hypothetical protein
LRIGLKTLHHHFRFPALGVDHLAGWLIDKRWARRVS